MTRMASVRAVAPGSVCERVARVKSSKRRRRTTVRPTRLAFRMRQRHAVDQADEDGVDLLGRPAPAAQRALRADRSAPAPSLHRPRVAVVGERVKVAP